MNFSQILLRFSRFQKQLIAVTFDIILSFFCFYLSLTLRLERLFFELNYFFPHIFLVLLFLPFFFWRQQYKSIFRYFGLSSIKDIFIATFAYGILIAFIFIYFDFEKNTTINWNLTDNYLFYINCI